MPSIRHWVTAQHTRPTCWGQWLLALPTLGYRLGLWCWQGTRKLGFLGTTRLNTPVISVGNLTTGGTGKTPVVITLAKHLLELGATVVVLSRGYGATELPASQGLPIPTGPQHGDEPWLIQKEIAPLGGTVLVGSNRARNAKQAEADLSPDVFILDDGFQHQKLARDVDIVLIDGTMPVHNATLLPAGPYREPVSSLSRGVTNTWCWVSKGTPPQQQATTHYLQQLANQHHWPLTVTAAPIHPTQWHQPLLNTDIKQHNLPPETIYSKPCIAVSGLANNSAFSNMLHAHSIRLSHALTYTDHHAYTAVDIHAIQLQADGAPIITTQKDWVKLAPLLANAPNSNTINPSQWWVVTVAPQLPLDTITLWWHNRVT